MQKLQEMVLYYQAGQSQSVRLMKSVLVRMGVRIKNIRADQVMEKVGYLAGIEGYSARSAKEQDELPVLSRDVLVMKNFTSSRIDVMLSAFKKAGVPKIELKAVITPQNVEWSFYQLYQELIEEHEQLGERDAKQEKT